MSAQGSLDGEPKFCGMMRRGSEGCYRCVARSQGLFICCLRLFLPTRCGMGGLASASDGAEMSCTPTRSRGALGHTG